MSRFTRGPDKYGPTHTSSIDSQQTDPVDAEIARAHQRQLAGIFERACGVPEIHSHRNIAAVARVIDLHAGMGGST